MGASRSKVKTKEKKEREAVFIQHKDGEQHILFADGSSVILRAGTFCWYVATHSKSRQIQKCYQLQIQEPSLSYHLFRK
jgi:hypothetical protein